MDHAAPARRLYDLISAGVVDAFGELLEDDFRRARGDARPLERLGSESRRPCRTRFEPRSRRGPARSWRVGLEIALGNRPHHLHAMTSGDLVESIRVGIATLDRCTQLVEVADHRRRSVEIELPTGLAANPEAMRNPSRDEDERTCRAGRLPPIEEDDVLASQNSNPARGARLIARSSPC